MHIETYRSLNIIIETYVIIFYVGATQCTRFIVMWHKLKLSIFKSEIDVVIVGWDGYDVHGCVNTLSCDGT